MSARGVGRLSRTTAGRPGARRPATRQTIILTGIAGRLGQMVARHLHRSHTVIGLDPRRCRGLPKDIAHQRVDYRRRKAEDVFRRARPTTLIHLGMVHHLDMPVDEAFGFNVVGTQRLLEFCQRYGVRKVVMLSSADVYGPIPGSDHYIDEDVTLQGDLHYPEMRTAVSMDRMVQTFSYMEPRIETVLLRPAHIVGPRLRNAVVSYLRLPLCPVIMGFDPMLQALHVEDLLAALAHCLRPRVRGVYNLAGPEAAPLSRLLRAVGKRTLPVPAPLIRAVAEQLWRRKLLAFPPPEIDHLQYNLVLDTRRMREQLGFSPTWGWSEIIADMRAHLRSLAR